MRFRFAFVLTIVGALAPFLAAVPTPQTTPNVVFPPTPTTIVDDNAVPATILYQGGLVYKPFDATPFGSTCRICPDDISQGALNDCSLLSALGAVASVNPGVIQQAIADTQRRYVDGQEIYMVRYYDSRGLQVGFPMTNTFPAENTNTLNVWSYNVTKLNWGSPLTPNFLFAHPPSYGSESAIARFTQSNPLTSLWSKAWGGPRGTSWPMLLEKAYAAMLPDGYISIQPGIDAKVALSAVTGEPSQVHDVNAPQASTTQLDSVWIHDSPAVADLGGHSIIGGLLRGDLHAVEPNLQVCVNLGSEKRINCTQICHESHACRQVLPVSIALPKGEKLHVKLLDVDRPGSVHEVADFDLDEPAQCTEQSTCKKDVPANQWGLGGTVEISFTSRQASASPLAYIDAVLSEQQKLRKAIIVGTPPACANKVLFGNPPTTCDDMFQPQGPLVRGHAYFLKSYLRNGVNLAANQVVVGDPHGSAETITLDEFYHTFSAIVDSQTRPASSNCGCN